MGADKAETPARLNAHCREFLEPTIAEHNRRGPDWNLSV
jgi:hypothetical protein